MCTIIVSVVVGIILGFALAWVLKIYDPTAVGCAIVVLVLICGIIGGILAQRIGSKQPYADWTVISRITLEPLKGEAPGVYLAPTKGYLLNGYRYFGRDATGELGSGSIIADQNVKVFEDQPEGTAYRADLKKSRPVFSHWGIGQDAPLYKCEFHIPKGGLSRTPAK